MDVASGAAISEVMEDCVGVMGGDLMDHQNVEDSVGDAHFLCPCLNSALLHPYTDAVAAKVVELVTCEVREVQEALAGEIM